MSEFIKDNYWTIVNIIEGLGEALEKLNEEMDQVKEYLVKNTDTVNWCVKEIEFLKSKKTPV